MGYQESYVTINGNVDELISIIQKLGKNHFDYRNISPVDIITLQQDISGDCNTMCKPEQKYKFNKGDKFVYVAGEKSGQRSARDMFGDCNKCKLDGFCKLDNIIFGCKIDDIEIYFTECFPSDRIFTEEGFALHEEFVWEYKKEKI